MRTKMKLTKARGGDIDGIKTGRKKIGQTGRNLERSTKYRGLNGRDK